MGDNKNPDYSSMTLIELVSEAEKELGETTIEQLEHEFVTSLALRLLLEVKSETHGLCDNNQSLMLCLTYEKMCSHLNILQKTLHTVLDENIKTLDIKQ